MDKCWTSFFYGWAKVLYYANFWSTEVNFLVNTTYVHKSMYVFRIEIFKGSRTHLDKKRISINFSTLWKTKARTYTQIEKFPTSHPCVKVVSNQHHVRIGFQTHINNPPVLTELDIDIFRARQQQSIAPSKMSMRAKSIIRGLSEPTITENDLDNEEVLEENDVQERVWSKDSDEIPEERPTPPTRISASRRETAKKKRASNRSRYFTTFVDALVNHSTTSYLHAGLISHAWIMTTNNSFDCDCFRACHPLAHSHIQGKDARNLVNARKDLIPPKGTPTHALWWDRSQIFPERIPTPGGKLENLVWTRQ